MKFGSLIVKDGKIIGRGWNHKAGPEEARGPGQIRMGYAFHAEVAALNDAIGRGHDVKGAEVYVAGFFPEDRMVYIPKRPHFSCDHCPRYLTAQEIRGVKVPSRKSWAFLPTAKVVAMGKDYHRKRLAKTISREQIGHTSVTVDQLLAL